MAVCRRWAALFGLAPGLPPFGPGARCGGTVVARLRAIAIAVTDLGLDLAKLRPEFITPLAKLLQPLLIKLLEPAEFGALLVEQLAKVR